MRAATSGGDQRQRSPAQEGRFVVFEVSIQCEPAGLIGMPKEAVRKRDLPRRCQGHLELDRSTSGAGFSLVPNV